MGKGYFDYVDALPEGAGVEPLPDQIQAAIAGTTYAERKAELEKAAALKDAIAAQMEQGQEPQFVLYAAFELIGIYAEDPEWAKEQRARLDAVYNGLEQQSFLEDGAAVVAARRQKAAEEYAAKARRAIQTTLNRCAKLEKKLQEALEEVDGLDGGGDEK